jgi:hypothetical protein
LSPAGSLLIINPGMQRASIILLYWSCTSYWTWMWEIFMQGHILSTAADALNSTVSFSGNLARTTSLYCI